MIQRPLAFATVTLENLEEIALWYDQLEDDPADDSVAVFTDNCNKKEWFESIASYLARKKAKTTGLCLLYVVREIADLPAAGDDPGYGMYPSFHSELLVRGCLSGHFQHGQQYCLDLSQEQVSWNHSMDHHHVLQDHKGWQKSLPGFVGTVHGSRCQGFVAQEG